MYQLRLLLSNEEQAAYDRGFEVGSNWKNSYEPGGPWINPDNWQSQLNWVSWMEGFATATNDDRLFGSINGMYDWVVKCKPS